MTIYRIVFCDASGADDKKYLRSDKPRTNAHDNFKNPVLWVLITWWTTWSAPSLFLWMATVGRSTFDFFVAE
jgi:hypothetical protein